MIFLTILLTITASGHAAEDPVDARTVVELMPLLRVLQHRFSRVATRETAYIPERYVGHPLTEHCGAVAYAIQRRLGGTVLIATYQSEDGEVMWHLWNKLTIKPTANDPLEVDLTRIQFDERDPTFAPPGQTLNYRNKTFHQTTLAEYQWNQSPETAVPEKIKMFWKAQATHPSASDGWKEELATKQKL